MNETAKQEILYFLKGFASKDENFASKFDEKYIDKCCEYIVGQAKKELKGTSGCIDSDTVFQWARHYFLEEMYVKEIADQKEMEEKIEAQREQKANEKREKQQAKTGQLSIFDLGV